MTIKAVNVYNSIISQQTASKQSISSAASTTLSESGADSGNMTLMSPLGLMIPDLMSHHTIAIDDSVEGMVTRRILDSK